MTDVFLIQNQQNLFLSKQGDWIDGKDAHSLFRTCHKDEAVNVRVEQSVRDPLLRLRIITCPTNGKGEPLPFSGCQAAAGQIDQALPGLFTVPNERVDASQSVTTPVTTPPGLSIAYSDSSQTIS